jgi:CDP-6-deoxy-D-xylo-4-hexulose-3-dehydrase
MIHLKANYCHLLERIVGKEIKPVIDYIPVTGKIISAEDIMNGVDAAMDGWLTAGRFANQFDDDFASDPCFYRC